MRYNVSTLKRVLPCVKVKKVKVIMAYDHFTITDTLKWFQLGGQKFYSVGWTESVVLKPICKTAQQTVNDSFEE